MNISYRDKIDGLDDKILELFIQRMEVVSQIADYKRENDLPVLDAVREQQKLQDVADKCPEELREYAGLLFKRLFELSRSYQKKRMGYENKLLQDIDGPASNAEGQLQN